MSSHDDIPKPDFDSFEKRPNNSQHCSPERPPMLKVVNTPKAFHSADNSPTPHHRSNHSLSNADRKSIKAFLSMVSNMQQSLDDLYGFCEHFFNEELTTLAIGQVERHVQNLQELRTRITTQQQVTEQLRQEQTPSPVSFSISSWKSKNMSSEEWPEPSSTDWVTTVASQFCMTPPELPPSPKKTTPSWEERLTKAEIRRRRNENLRNREIRQKTNKVRRANEKRVQQQEEAITLLNEKQDNAAQRREAHIKSKKEKAHSELEKINETRVMQSLESQGLKLQLDRNMKDATKRHNQRIQEKTEKARERTISKIPSTHDLPTPEKPRKNMKPDETEIIDAIIHGMLPDIVMETTDDDCAIIPMIPLPNFRETNPKPNARMKSLKAKMNSDKTNPQLASNYLKCVIDTNNSIKWNSTEGNMIRETVQYMLQSNLPNTNQILHQVIATINNSLPFCLHIAVESLSSFTSFCFKRNSLPATIELLGLCQAILSSSNEEAKCYIISSLLHSNVLKRLCSLLSVVVISDLKNEQLKHLIQIIIDLFYPISVFYHSSKPNIPSDLFENYTDATKFMIFPSILTFLTVARMDKNIVSINILVSSVRVLSYCVVDFTDSIIPFLDEQIVGQLVLVMKAYISDIEQKAPIAHELIVLLGLICRHSSLMRESCCWSPSPTILSNLCDLPISYFLQKAESSILIPTLIACCIDSDENMHLIAKNIKLTMLSKYMETLQDNKGDICSPSYRIPTDRIKELKEKFNKI